MLALVSAVRESNIERHMEAERVMTNQAFALDHPNYARYGAYQQTYLQHLRNIQHPAYESLKNNGFGASISGDKFSSIHGDLITEIFNKETKGNSGPFRKGFSTDIDTVSTWVNTIHIHSQLRVALRQKLHIKTSTKHKEITSSGIMKHINHVKSLKATLRKYGYNPFSDTTPKCISTGVEVAKEIYFDMISVDEIGEKKYQDFMKDCLINGSINFFASIKRSNLDTGIKKKKKSNPPAMNVLKEDCQAFEVIASKSVNIENAFNYPITSVPLAIATPDGKLRQSDKASFRNYILRESKATIHEYPNEVTWLVDGLALIR